MNLSRIHKRVQIDGGTSEDNVTSGTPLHALKLENHVPGKTKNDGHLPLLCPTHFQFRSLLHSLANT